MTDFRPASGGDAAETYACAVAAALASPHRHPIPVMPEAGELGATAPVRLAEPTGWSHVDPREDLCLAADEPIVREAGALLAGLTGRKLHLVSADAFASQLGELLASGPASIALVAPGWDASGKASPSWLRAVLAFARSGAGFGATRWGLVTAPSPASLTQLVARTVHDPATLSESPPATITVASLMDGELTQILPAPDAAADGLGAVDRRHLADGRFAALLRRRHGALVFRGHGRSYCAVDGHLCGARPVDGPADAPVRHCLSGMECQGTRFAQLDPRSYQAPIMVLDCCGAANAFAPNWAEGHPSLAYYALAGNAVALVASDGVTMGGPDELIDVLAALAWSATLGEALDLLNRQRLHAAAEAPYLLLGDPLLRVGPQRFPAAAGAATVTEQDGLIRVDLSASDVRLWRAPVPRIAAGDALHIDGKAPPGVTGFRLVRGMDGDAIWCVGSGDPASFALRVEPRALIADEILAAAVDLPRHAAPLSARAAAHLVPLRTAAEQLQSVARALDRSRRRIADGIPGGAPALAAMGVGRWESAQLTCLSSIVAEFRTEGLWPFLLWATHDFESRHTDEHCPYCGAAAVLHRRYRSPPLGRREQRECMGCDLIDDIDTALAATVSARLEAPDAVAKGKGAEVSVHLSNCSQAPVMGGCAIALDGIAHGASVEPLVRSFSMAPGHTTRLTARLQPVDPLGIGHRYRLKALLLVDGRWMLLSRPVRIGGGGGQ